MKSIVVLKIDKVLKQCLAEKRLSLRALSKSTGVPYSTLQEWSNNRTPKNPIQVQKVATFLGISMHFLLFAEADPEEPLQKILKEDFFKGTFEISIKRVQVVDKSNF